MKARTAPVVDSESYRLLKSHVLGSDFPWYWVDPHRDSRFPFYSHTLIERPERGMGVPKVVSSVTELAQTVVIETCEANSISVDCFYRMAVNCTDGRGGYKRTSETHVDHDFDHQSLLIYLTDSDGATVVGGERYEPVEDTALFFIGEHYHERPTGGRRVVLVATFL